MAKSCIGVVNLVNLFGPSSAVPGDPQGFVGFLWRILRGQVVSPHSPRRRKPLSDKKMIVVNLLLTEIHHNKGDRVNICFNEVAVVFTPWKPQHGQVFERPFAFDCETTLIDTKRPWLTPAYVIGAATDGRTGWFVTREHLSSFTRAHLGDVWVFHNAAFDLGVIEVASRDLDVYTLVDGSRVADTQLLHKLLVLGSAGHVAAGKGESTLDSCSQLYLGADLPKDVTDSRGNVVRLSYSRWLNKPPSEIELVYLQYLGTDVIATWMLFNVLVERHRQLRVGGRDAFGFVSDGWLTEQTARWGPQTHHIQLQAAIALPRISANGLHLDGASRTELEATLRDQAGELKRSLSLEHGLLVAGQGSDKSLQAVLKREERRCGFSFPRTGTGKYETSADTLADLATEVPFAAKLAEFKATNKLLTSFLSKMDRPVVHPSFGVLTRSGRTTSFGELNAQNLPRDDRVRSCFVPSPGHVFIIADYSTIELATLSQACRSQFGLDSHMGRAINAGKDLHRLVAARFTGLPEEEVSKDERQKAKPVNFGKPGGLGNRSLRAYAKHSYGVELTEAEVAELSDAWFGLFPEMRTFLAQDVDVPLNLARWLGLTCASRGAHSGGPVEWGLSRVPNAVLGAMCLKVLGNEQPLTRNGKPYVEEDVDYLWTRFSAKASELSAKALASAQRREPSSWLQREVASHVGQAGVFTFTGRLRGDASFTQRRNTAFQGLAADGAKLALWRLWRTGYRIVNFVHDEFVIEVHEDSDLRWHAEEIRRLMIEGMREVVSDVRIDVSYAAARRWHKNAEVVSGPDGELLPWEPGLSADPVV